ncbi:MAG TPA: lipase maturation factor family protein [Candidatus Acidoferrales bacterium]|nr:lipase maturation factor family protein [Candidatus Acidoferrales bacterium]
MEWYFGDVWLVRLLFLRALAALYLLAFIAVLRQFKPLLGERGLLPVPAFVKRITFDEAPSLFCWRYSDRLVDAVGWTGVVLSAAALIGLLDRGPVWLSIAVWLLLWFLYLSIINVGQKFYGFGWESMMLEAGFFAAFMGPAWVKAPLIPVLILRWMLFRTELGAGLIKLRHDQCWRDLTCLYYHYETQPLPNPLSWYFHHLPKSVHRFSVLFSHFVQVIVPFGLFAPQPVAAVAGGLLIFHQLLLIVSGNYSWLNWLTVVLGVTAFSDSILSVLGISVPPAQADPVWFQVLLYVIAAGAVALSFKPALNLFSSNQLMNYSYNRFHLINTYGAFGSVTRTRYEIVLEGTDEPILNERTQWHAYEFKAKPGDPRRMPPQLAPYHLRLDWLMWFLPFSVMVTGSGALVPGYEVWFMRFVQKLLQDDAAALTLIKHNPFRGKRPAFIRALYYEYHFTSRQEKRETGAWWTRRLIDEYLPPVSLAHLRQV